MKIIFVASAFLWLLIITNIYNMGVFDGRKLTVGEYNTIINAKWNKLFEDNPECKVENDG